MPVDEPVTSATRPSSRKVLALMLKGQPLAVGLASQLDAAGQYRIAPWRAWHLLASPA
jgi:hypothetical protein